MPHHGDFPDPGRVARRDQEHAEALELLRDARAYCLVVVPKDGGIQCVGSAVGGRDATCIAVGLAGMLESFPGADYEELVQMNRDMVEHDERAEMRRLFAEHEEEAA